MGFQKLSGGFQKRLKGMGFLVLHSTRIKKKKKPRDSVWDSIK